MIRWVSIATLLGAAGALAQEPPPFVRTRVVRQGAPQDYCLHWKDREYAYHYDSVGSEKTPGTDEFFAMDAAFQTWEGLAATCSDFKFTRRTPIQSPPVGFVRTQACDENAQCPDEHPNSCFQPGTGVCNTATNVCTYQPRAGMDCTNHNVLAFYERACWEVVPDGDPCYDAEATQGDPYSCNSKYRCWDGSEGTIALTSAFHSTLTGQIFDADIEFNASPASDGTSFLFTTVNSPRCDATSPDISCVANDIQNTLTHEIGHVIGLDHTEAVGSTMEATAPVGETKKRIIDYGTALGFCSIYPRGQATPVTCGEPPLVTTQMIGNGTPSLSSIFGCQQVPSSAALPLFGLAGLLAAALLRRRR